MTAIQDTLPQDRLRDGKYPGCYAGKYAGMTCQCRGCMRERVEAFETWKAARTKPKQSGWERFADWLFMAVVFTVVIAVVVTILVLAWTYVAVWVLVAIFWLLVKIF
jgi:Flp pilus assembly protein TadB